MQREDCAPPYFTALLGGLDRSRDHSRCNGFRVAAIGPMRPALRRLRQLEQSIRVILDDALFDRIPRVRWKRLKRRVALHVLGDGKPPPCSSPFAFRDGARVVPTISIKFKFSQYSSSLV